MRMTPAYELHLNRESRVTGKYTSDVKMHSIVTSRSTISIETLNIPLAATIDVKLYSCFYSGDPYWNLVEHFSLTASDFPDPDASGKSAYNEAITHPVFPYTKLVVELGGATTIFGASVLYGL